MGRGGGSSGGRSSGGSFGGSRSSGGRSFGGFSSGRGGSFGSGMFGSGSSGGRMPTGGGSFMGGGRQFFGGGMGPLNFGSGRSGGGAGTSGCGCLSVVVLIILLVVVLTFTNLGSIFGGGDTTDITKSTVQRVALPAGSVNETAYYTDELGWIQNKTTLLAGMKNFYKKTGVQPYLYLTDTVDGSHNPTVNQLDEYAQRLYDELFTDEAHILLVFFEYNSNGKPLDQYVCGRQAETVIDTEAADILLDYITRYYYDDSLSEDEMFSKAFNDAGERIMSVTKSPWITVMIVLGVLALVVVLFFWWQNAKKQKNLEAQQTEELLKTPLEKFGDKEVEILAEKYDDDKQ